MTLPTTKEERFRNSLKDARTYRKELLEQLTDKIQREDKLPLKYVPVSYGILGDLELDISLLEQLLSIETK